MQMHERKAARKNPLLDAEPGVPASVIQALAGSLDDAFLLEATATQYRTTLGRLEGDGRFRSALRADRSRFRASRAGTGSAPGFALLAPLGVILELLVEEKQLLTGSEHEIVPAVHTFENLVDELHPLPSPSPEAPSLPRRIGPTHHFRAGRFRRWYRNLPACCGTPECFPDVLLPIGWGPLRGDRRSQEHPFRTAGHGAERPERIEPYDAASESRALPRLKCGEKLHRPTAGSAVPGARRCNG